MLVWPSNHVKRKWCRESLTIQIVRYDRTRTTLQINIVLSWFQKLKERVTVP